MIYISSLRDPLCTLDHLVGDLIVFTQNFSRKYLNSGVFWLNECIVMRHETTLKYTYKVVKNHLQSIDVRKGISPWWSCIPYGTLSQKLRLACVPPKSPQDSMMRYAFHGLCELYCRRKDNLYNTRSARLVVIKSVRKILSVNEFITNWTSCVLFMWESVAHWTIALAFSVTGFTAEKRLSHFVSHQAQEE